MSATIGQDLRPKRAMLVIIDEADQAHAWDIYPVNIARWEWTGVGSSGRSTAHVTLDGEFHRRSRNLSTLLNQIGIEQ